MKIKRRNILLIFDREVRDQLRDRRMLFMMVVLPMLLYPALAIGMVQLNFLFREQPRSVVVLGAEHLPEPQLLNGNRFQTKWFTDGELDASRLLVISDQAQELTEAQKELLAVAQSLSEPINQYAQATQKLSPTDSIPEEVKKQTELLASQLTESRIQVLVLIPPGFRKSLEEVTKQIVEVEKKKDLPDYARPIVVHNSADEKSEIAYSLVREVLGNWEKEILAGQLKAASLPATLPQPVRPHYENLALDVQVAANAWSKILPIMLVIMAITGAFYPAIDLCAGEKERGTMETLLICPATRTEIVLGKFLTILLFSVATAILNLLSMGFTMWQLFSMTGKVSINVDTALPTPFSLCLMLITLIPLASLFSALCLALATFARSSKEGQYYLTPLLMVAMGLVVFSSSPGIELNEKTPYYAILPVANVALLLKGVLLNPQNATIYLYSIPVLISTAFYGVLALWWAIEQFQREDVLFREAERFDLRLWIKHLLRDKEPTPTFSEAVFCFIVLILLMFGSMRAIGQASLGPDGQFDTNRMFRALTIQQIALIATPALLMGILLTSQPLKTFRLKVPKLSYLGVGLGLAFTLNPLIREIHIWLSKYFPELPQEMQSQFSRLENGEIPLGVVIAVMAGAPAFCEEIAFRGFILSGLSRGSRNWLAIVLSAMMFGLIHMIPQQVFNASIVGILLGWLAIKSGSLLVPIAFHFVNNALMISLERLKNLEQVPQVILYRQEGGLRFGSLTLTLALIATTILLYTLVKLPKDQDDA